MPKAKGKGGKNRRRGKNDGNDEKRELVFKEDGQEYAQVVKMLGNGRLEAKCQDGETRLGQIRGQMRKKVWITAGDIILLSLREFQDDKADVIHRYTPDEARNLKTYGELKSDFQINEAAEEGGVSDEEGGVEFEEAEIDDICECTGVWERRRRSCITRELSAHGSCITREPPNTANSCPEVVVHFRAKLRRYIMPMHSVASMSASTARRREGSGLSQPAFRSIRMDACIVRYMLRV